MLRKNCLSDIARNDFDARENPEMALNVALSFVGVIASSIIRSSISAGSLGEKYNRVLAIALGCAYTNDEKSAFSGATTAPKDLHATRSLRFRGTFERVRKE